MKNKEDVGSLCWWQRLSVDGVWQESQVLKSYEIVRTDYGNIALSWHISSEPSSLKGQENWSWNIVAGCLIKRLNIQILNCSKKVSEWLQLFSSIGSICWRKKNYQMLGNKGDAPDSADLRRLVWVAPVCIALHGWRERAWMRQDH